MSAVRPRVLVVETHERGIRVADLIGRELPSLHPLDLRQLLRAGAVEVNGEACLDDRRLRAGDVVTIQEAGLAERRRGSRASEAPTPSVLLETATVLVLDKPPGIPCVPDRSGAQRGIHGMLAGLRPGADLRIVHRLDRDTSGCLILAKGLTAARHLDQEFRAHRVAKAYVALVAGLPPAPEFAIDAFLGPDPRRPGKVLASNSARAGFREAHTVVTVRAAYRRHALLELRPATGRGHQLRVHLQSVGLPIVGDGDYGGEALLLSSLKPEYKVRIGVSERPLLQRLFLHAEQVRFTDVDGGAVAVAAPLPADLATALRHVEKHQTRRSPPCA